MRIILLTVVLLALGVPAVRADTAAHQTEELARYQQYAGTPVEQFPMWHLYQWQVVGERKIVVWTTIQDAYLITVYAPCPRLDFTHALVLTTSMARQVTRKFDYVTFDHQRCPMAEIRPIDYRRLQADAKNAAAQNNKNPVNE